MERIEEDATPAEEWLQQLNATCNRLSTQYLNLLRAASSVQALEEGRHDPRGGGAPMKSIADPPPTPLAADVALSSLQCRAAAENLCAACSQLCSLIRTLRLSLLLMDQDTMQAEECIQVHESQKRTQEALEQAMQLEQELMKMRRGQN